MFRPLCCTYVVVVRKTDELLCSGYKWVSRCELPSSCTHGLLGVEWSRCPGFMARRPRGSVVPLRQSSAGWMPARNGRLSAGVGFRHPLRIHKASLMVGSIGGNGHCVTKQECSTLQSNGPGLG